MVKLIQADRPVVLWPSGQPSGPSARRGGTHGRCSRDRLRSLIPSSMGGGDEKALPSRRQPTWGATQKGVKAEGVGRAPKAASRQSQSAALQVELAQFTRELNDSLKRETATADVLKIISC